MRRAAAIACVTSALVIAATAFVSGAHAQVPTRDTVRSGADSARRAPGATAQQPAALTTPTQDLTRTIDAEVRVALFELSNDQIFPALSRLERLTSMVTQDSASVPADQRAALHFLLAETDFKLGLLDGFRREAEATLALGETRYAPVLRPQLLVEAYRTGDYARAVSLGRELPSNDSNGVAQLVAGLAAYQSGDLGSARASFGRAATAGGEFGAYAKYMDALAQLRGDTAHAATALASLQAVAASATGTFADQARLTAAQVAYEAGQFADAERLAASIPESSALAAPALFTRAWSVYKLNRVDDAERAFSDFATKYPSRPEHGEALLMAAQAQLELGRSADAERVFQRVADSSSIELRALQAQTNAAIAEMARILVGARGADLLVASDPAGAKAITVNDSLSSAAALAAVTGADLGAATTGSHVVIAAVPSATKLDSIASRAPPTVQRVLFAPASATTQPRELAVKSQTLAAADAAVAVARYRLDEQVDGQQREIALLTGLSASLAADSAALGPMTAQYRTLADSIARLDQMMAAAEARLRRMLGQEIDVTRSLAAENAKTADSIRTLVAASAAPEDRAALDDEVAAAAAYTRVAEIASRGLDSAIAHHPAFAMRDSLRAHNAKAAATLASLQGAYTGSRAGVTAALAALRGGDSPAVRAARGALADAESSRRAAEGAVIAAVTAELSARAAEMVTGLEKNTEAAQFGVASAAFFRAIDGNRAVGAAGSGGNASASRVPAPERRR